MTKTEALVSIAQALLRNDGADTKLPTACQIASAVNKADSLLWCGEELREEAFSELTRRYTLAEHVVPREAKANAEPDVAKCM